ncbi:unnamed protein product [Meloidogyne enterolobii]|uniref:Uncharacterized protein n=1 Tax=Meloidogyne enterolobii TaxID=390850 RepID=A0ACB0YP05_MELEN
MCCTYNCINTNKPSGKCVKGYGYGNIIDGENIKYINCLEGKGVCDKWVLIYAENSFKNPQNSLNYSLYYFEIKCKFERELNKGEKYLSVGLKNLSTRNHIYYSAKQFSIYYNMKNEKIHQPTPSWNNNDIFGCGLVYPPTNKLTEESPYVFFTQNGKQIGKATLVKDSYESPCVWLQCCSIEANFGNNLESKPFKYDVSNHLILKESY